MADIKFTVSHVPRIPENGWGFTGEDMRLIAVAGITGMSTRLDAAQNRFDRPAPPLKEKYSRRKQRRGAKPIRDLKLTGRLRAAIEATNVVENHCSIEVRGGSLEWRKAYFNQRRDPWFGLSPTDADRLDAEFERIHQQHTREAWPII